MCLSYGWRNWFVFSVDGVSYRGSDVRATRDTGDTVELIDSDGGTSVPSVVGM